MSNQLCKSKCKRKCKRLFVDRALHFMIGFILMLSFAIASRLGLSFGSLYYLLMNILFIIYEFNEDMHLKDCAYIDILDFAKGQSVAFFLALFLSGLTI